MAERLAGQVAVVTGGAGGIGRALCAALRREGARVALLDLDAERLDAAVAGAGPGGGEQVRAVVCDVTDPASCEAAIADVVAAWGGVDVLVNNAGISHRSLFEDTDPAVFRRVVEVNLFGSVHCTRAALPSLRARRGVVAALSSVAGFAPLTGRTAYAASKHALHGFFDTLRVELAGDGVGVVLVCPAFTDSGMDDRVLAGDGSVRGPGKATIGRVLTPADVARAAVEGIVRRRPRVLVSRVARVSWWVSRVAPPLYARLMRRSQAKDYPAGRGGHGGRGRP